MQNLRCKRTEDLRIDFAGKGPGAGQEEPRARPSAIERASFTEDFPGPGQVVRRQAEPHAQGSFPQFPQGGRREKKTVGGRLRLVLPVGIGKVEIVESPDEAALMEVLSGA